MRVKWALYLLTGGFGLGKLLKVCDLSEIQPGKMLPVNLSDREIMVVNVNGKMYATDRICTHAYADLSLGFLMGNRVTCPLHLSQFDVTTGKALSPPATEPLRTYNVRVEGTSVYVEAPD